MKMIQKRKHTPQRTCVVCREVKPKKQLTRLVRCVDGNVEIDESGKKAGRGAYLCENPDCWSRAATGRMLEKALRAALTNDERQMLEMYVQEHVGKYEDN